MWSSFESVISVFGVAGLFCLLQQVSATLWQRTRKAPAKLQRQLNFTFLQFFDLFFVSPACSACRQPVLFISNQFLHFPVTIFQRNLLVNHVFVVGD
jgi:hypothetical protein